MELLPLSWTRGIRPNPHGIPRTAPDTQQVSSWGGLRPSWLSWQVTGNSAPSLLSSALENGWVLLLGWLPWDTLLRGTVGQLGWGGHPSGSQAPFAAHFLVSLALFLRSVFFLKVPTKCSVTQAIALKECQGCWWALVWSLQAPSLAMFPLQPLLLPQATGPLEQSQQGHEPYTACVGRGVP